VSSSLTVLASDDLYLLTPSATGVPGNMSKGQWKYTRGYLRLVSTVTAFAAILTPLDSTIVSVSLPAIARGLRASYLETIWVPMGYLVSLSAFLLLFGRLGDVRGKEEGLHDRVPRVHRGHGHVRPLNEWS